MNLIARIKSRRPLERLLTAALDDLDDLVTLIHFRIERLRVPRPGRGGR